MYANCRSPKAFRYSGSRDFADTPFVQVFVFKLDFIVETRICYEQEQTVLLAVCRQQLLPLPRDGMKELPMLEHINDVHSGRVHIGCFRLGGRATEIKPQIRRLQLGSTPRINVMNFFAMLIIRGVASSEITVACP